jgi:hypothetical protein
MISLTIFFLVESEKNKSEYKLFLNYLPKSLQEYPLFFTEEKLEFLKGSYLYINFILYWKKQLQLEYESLLKLNIIDLFKIKEFTLEKYKFFRLLVWSRNFYTKLKSNNNYVNKESEKEEENFKENFIDLYENENEFNYIDINIDINKEKDNKKNDDLNFYKEISSLIPVADMFNTDPNKINTDWFFDEISGKFMLKAIKEIRKDEEVN